MMAQAKLATIGKVGNPPVLKGIVGSALRCPHCKLDIESRYIVYKRNPKTQAVEIGQYEPVHVRPDGSIAPSCNKTAYSRYLALDQESAYLKAKMGDGAVRTSSKTIHLIRKTVELDTLGRPMITLCGALGGRTTNDESMISCNNCKRAITQTAKIAAKLAESQSIKPRKDDKIMSTENTETTNNKPMTVKEKIAAARAKKDAVAGGKSASLVSKDTEVSTAAEETANAKGTKKSAKAPASAETKAKLKKLKETAKKEPINPCGCGCGELVAGSFRMGHDAKLHGWVKRVGDGRMKLSELPKQVRQGMFAGAVENEKGVKPKQSEANYLSSIRKN